MNAIMPKIWFTRSFDYQIDPETLPTLIERLAGVPARLEEKIRHIEPAVLTLRKDGKWSIQEQAGHLLDLEWLWFARIEDFRKGAEELTPADLQNRKTHEADHNSRPVGDILSDFRKERTRAIEALYSLPETAFHRTALHPRLRKPMRLADFAFFVAEHDDHHLAMMAWQLAVGS